MEKVKTRILSIDILIATLSFILLNKLLQYSHRSSSLSLRIAHILAFLHALCHWHWLCLLLRYRYINISDSNALVVSHPISNSSHRHSLSFSHSLIQTSIHSFIQVLANPISCLLSILININEIVRSCKDKYFFGRKHLFTKFVY